MARNKNAVAYSNVYTAIIGLALAAVLFTAGFVLYNCYTDYGVFFNIP